MKKCNTNCPERLGRVGGQAVLEGVMMKAGDRTVTTCRKEDGTLTVASSDFVSVRKKHKILDIPLLRGVVNFVEMMTLSVKILGESAKALGIEEEEETKFEKWLKKHFGIGIVNFVLALGTILGLGLAVLLFLVLPSAISSLIDYLVPVDLGVWCAVIEGGIKIMIFLLYLWLVSFMPEIKRTFMYHGAEHKSIACFESGEELTPENAKRHRRFHPRCGTSFMFFMILIGIFAGMIIKALIPGLHWALYTAIRILILPLVMGIGYEIIRLAGKHDNFITRALSAPGLWVQRITTKEPTLDMLEVAIVSLKCALRDEFPEFALFYAERPWEKKCEDEPADNGEGATAEEASANGESADSDIDEATTAGEVASDGEGCGGEDAVS
ncbi:MAG: DUF1385 domain-containing protein [Clostridia bacterium]|nr:DUF1385 domain-containing protein [Clostridia bacterium]